MKKRTGLAIVTLLLLASATSVFGQGAVTEPLYVGVTGAGGYYATISNAEFKGVKSYVLPAPLDLGGVATLDSLEVTYEADPSITLNFAVTNLTNATQTFTFNTSLLFAAIANPVANANIMVGASDRNGDGVTVGVGTGDPFAGKLYRGTYNGASIFCDMADPFFAPTGSPPYSFGNMPATSIPGPANSMQAEIRFSVSAMDSASVVSFYQITPEPATIGFMVLGLAGLARRRR